MNCPVRATNRDVMNWLTSMLKSLSRGIGELSPSCHEATRLQSEAMDRRLPLRKRVGLRIHLILCRWCRRYGKQIRFLRQAAYEHSDELVEAVPQRLSAEARERIKRKVEAGRRN